MSETHGPRVFVQNLADLETLRLLLSPSDETLGRVKITDGTKTASLFTQGTEVGLGTVILDDEGAPVTSFGSVTEYTDGGTPPANPEGPTLLWDDAGTWKHVSDTEPLPVTASIDTTGLALETKQDTQITHLSAIETAVEAIQAGQLADGHNVTVDNASIAVTHAALTELAAAIDTEVQVDIVAALPAGTNAIGKLAANSGVDIGDVDVLSSALPTGASTSAKQDTIIGHLDGVEGHLDGVEGLLTTIDADTGGILTAVQIMDDWDNGASDGASVSGDVAHDSADAGEPVKIGAKAYSPDGTTPGTAVAELDRTNLKSDLDGILYVQPMNPQNWSYHDDDTSAVTTDGTVHADPGDGFAIFITDIVFSIGAATASSIFLEEGSTKILGPYYLEAIAGRGLSIHFETPKRCTASTAVTVTNTGSISFSVDILGFVAAV